MLTLFQLNYVESCELKITCDYSWIILITDFISHFFIICVIWHGQKLFNLQQDSKDLKSNTIHCNRLMYNTLLVIIQIVILFISKKLV